MAIVETVSVEELIGLLARADGWKLSRTQRAFEWNRRKVTNLVDSLLRGFPIGTFLLHETSSPYYELSQKDKFHDVHQSAVQTRQILDGQQRSAAILAAFNGEGYFDVAEGKVFWLWVNLSQVCSDSHQFDAERGQRYFFHWSTRKRGLNGISAYDRRRDGFPRRAPTTGWLPFHAVCKWVGKGRPASSILQTAGIGDSVQASKIAARLGDEIRSCLCDKRIPVHVLSTAETDDSDVHQLFIRINTGGLQLSREDIFFAGVKRGWVDAEEHLRPLVEGESVFSRHRAIALLARVAGLSLPGKYAFDPVRLHLSDLSRHATGNSYPLVDIMKKLAAPGQYALLERVVQWLSRKARARLYHSVKLVLAPSLLAVAGWAFARASKPGGSNLFDGELPDEAVRFLFWSTVLSSSSCGRQRFEREALRKAWAAGKRGKPFPYDDVGFQSICFDYELVRKKLPDRRGLKKLDLENADGKAILNLMRWNKGLFLSVAQQIMVDSIDWDHIVAYNYAKQRFKTRNKLDDAFYWVNHIGNFAGIAPSANRHFQDKPPSFKLRCRKRSDGKHYGNRRFVGTKTFVTAGEEELFVQIGRLMDQEPRQKMKAERLFAEVVAKRSMRIWNRVLKQIGPPPRPVKRSPG